MTSRCSAGRSIVVSENPPRTVKRLFPRVLGQEPYLTTIWRGPERQKCRRWFLVALNVPIMALGSMAVSLQGAYLGDEEGDRARERRVQGRPQGRAVPRQHEAVSRPNRSLYDRDPEPRYRSVNPQDRATPTGFFQHFISDRWGRRVHPPIRCRKSACR